MSLNLLTLIGLLLCLMFAVAVVALIVILIIRAALRANPGGSLGPSLPAILTQLADDGFWITSCPVEPGSIIHFAYWSGGARHALQVPFQPDATGRQFVYTGAAPQQVSVLRITGASAGVVDILPPMINTPDPFWDSSSSSQSSSAPPGFPSAY